MVHRRSTSKLLAVLLLPILVGGLPLENANVVPLQQSRDCSRRQYFDLRRNRCWPCSQCSRELYPVPECKTQCKRRYWASNDDSSEEVSGSVFMVRRRGRPSMSFTQKLKEHMLNHSDGGGAPNHFGEYLNSRGGKAAAPNSVEGQVRYEQVDGSPIEREHDDLHSDLEAIERELLSRGRNRADGGANAPGNDLNTPSDARKKSKKKRKNKRKKKQNKGKDYNDKARDTAEKEVFHSDVNTASTASIILGKKRFYAAPPSQDELSHEEKPAEDPYHDVDEPETFGELRDSPELEEKRVTLSSDDMGLLKGLLGGHEAQEGAGDLTTPIVQGTSKIAAEEGALDTGLSVQPSTPSATSSASPKGLSLEQILMIVAFTVLLLIIIVPLIAYRQWRKLKAFKILDNQSPCQNLLSSHNSSFHRSTESRLTNHSSVPNSPSNRDMTDGKKLGGKHLEPSPSSTLTPTPLASPSSRSPSPSSVGGSSRRQMRVSYVDERGRTQIKDKELQV